MAAEQEQGQGVVAVRTPRRLSWSRRRGAGATSCLPVGPGPLAAQPVDQPARATVISQPRGLSGTPLARPLPRGGEQRLLGGVLGGVEVAVPAHQGGQHVRRHSRQTCSRPPGRSLVVAAGPHRRAQLDRAAGLGEHGRDLLGALRGSRSRSGRSRRGAPWSPRRAPRWRAWCRPSSCRASTRRGRPAPPHHQLAGGGDLRPSARRTAGPSRRAAPAAAPALRGEDLRSGGPTARGWSGSGSRTSSVAPSCSAGRLVRAPSLVRRSRRRRSRHSSRATGPHNCRVATCTSTVLDVRTQQLWGAREPRPADHSPPETGTDPDPRGRGQVSAGDGACSGAGQYAPREPNTAPKVRARMLRSWNIDQLST